MSKKWLLVAPVVGAVGLGIGAGVGADKLIGAQDIVKQDVKPAVSLPITRVVMFNSGVGYFSRSGEVEGDARVDLSFQEQDINDLLKSMTLEDFNGGRVAAVNYDSREPISRTLSSFAINLNGQPTFAGIVQQMRGERIEVVLSPGAANQPGKLSGVIVGIETQKVAVGAANIDAEFLNMWCAEGLRAVKLSDVQQLKFANPVIESEFRRALDVLARGHDSEKKSVALHFAGDGKRKVQVGYVIEAPIWKTSYRLVLNDKEKPYLQGWAMVENPTDEDWTGVKMALVSGRPISFKMDLYNPLYVDRPTVEPELFASLRPQTYRGGFVKPGEAVTGGQVTKQATIRFMAPATEQFFLEGLNDAERRNVSLGINPSTPTADSAIMGGVGGLGAVDSTRLRQLAEQWSGLPPDQRAQLAAQLKRDTPAKYQQRIDEYIQSLNRLHRIETGTVTTAATAAALGDSFQYAIDHPVTLPRQKSAMLPIVGKDIEGQKVSIYNESVQRSHPLLGLKFKNTSGAHLNQGPIAVFEGSVYAGDTRVLDVQPNEERLVSYAIDLGTEVDPQAEAGTHKITSVKAVKGVITQSVKMTVEKKYRIINRSQVDRTMLIEHPNRTNQQFKLVDTDKPVEDTPEVFRFQTAVKAGETKTFTVKEEKVLSEAFNLTNDRDDIIRHFLNLTEAGPALKEQLKKALEVKGEWDTARRELQQVVADLNRLNQDQDRIRKNLRETPKEVEVYATYLKKLSDQEKEIDTLTTKQKKLMDDEFTSRKKYDDFLANIAG